MKIHISDLTIDPEVQLASRGTDPNTVQDYVIAMSNGDQFPPIVVYRDNGTVLLSAGFHRVAAAQFLGLAEIEAEVREGGRQDAMVFAATDNAKNARPMSQAEKREAGERLLQLTDWSDYEIARKLAVDQKTVWNWRNEASKEFSLDRPGKRTVTRNGTTYTMDVSNIGKKEPKPEVEPEASQEEPLDFERLLDEDDEPVLELCAHCAWNNRLDRWVCLKTGEAWYPDSMNPPCPYCDMYEPESEAADEPEPEEQQQPGPMAIHYSSKTPEHYTPQCIIDAALACMGEIDLDPCSNSHVNPVVPAVEHYTVDDNGLMLPWHGRVYMNPPYGREIDDWIAKLCMEHEDGGVEEAIALVPARPDTQWWLRLRDYPVCFITGRLTFGGNDDPAPFPSAVFYLGYEIGKFYRVFNELGDCWQRMMPGVSFGE